MATIVAQATGNWSAGATWTGGVKPGAGDVAQTGAYVVTIDENVTCTTLETTSSGYFTVTSGGITINANVVHSGSYATNGGLRLTHTTGTVTVNGNVTGGSASASIHTIVNSDAGTLTVVGTIQGGNGNAIRNVSTGTVNVTGNMTGGTGSTDIAFYNVSTGAVNITGNCTGGSGSSSQAINNNSTGIVTIVGNVTGGSAASAHGAYNNSTGTVTCDMATGGSNASAAGLYGNDSGGTTTYKRIGSQTNGCTAIGGFCKMVVDADYNVIVVKDSAGNDVSMSNDYPAVTNVKDGVVYNRTTQTGTYAVASGGGGPLFQGRLVR